MNAYDIPDAIQWHEGLLLTPQHFQQLTMRHEALVQYSTSLVAPFCWGIRRLKHNAISLASGNFQVLELEAIMPDGLVVSHNAAQGTAPLEVVIKKDQMGDKPIVVNLAVAARNPENSNGESRYVPSSGGLVQDETSGGKAREISRLKPLLKLIAADSLPAKFVGFPLAKLIYRDASLKLDDQYVPPLLTVPMQSTSGDVPVLAAQRLADMCSEPAKRLRERAKYLAAEKDSDPSDGASRSDTATRNLVLSLVGCLSQFEALLKIGVAHPFAVYLGLCGIAGQLAVLGKEMVPPDFKPYDHNDLYRSFKPVLDFIDRTLDQGVPLSYKSYPFEYHKPAFELHFESEWMNKDLVIGIKGPRGVSDSEVVRWGESCYIGSESRMESIRKNRIRGAGRKPANQVGHLRPAKREALFVLKVDTNFIKEGETLQIINSDPQPLEIVLHVMGHQPSGSRSLNPS